MDLKDKEPHLSTITESDKSKLDVIQCLRRPGVALSALAGIGLLAACSTPDSEAKAPTPEPSETSTSVETTDPQPDVEPAGPVVIDTDTEFEQPTGEITYDSLVEELSLSTSAYRTGEQAFGVGFVGNLNTLLNLDYKLQEGEEYLVDSEWLANTVSAAVIDSMYGEDRLTEGSPYAADIFPDGFTNNVAGVYDFYVNRTDGQYQGEFNLVEMNSVLDISTAEHDGVQEHTMTVEYIDNYEDFEGLLPEQQGGRLYSGDITLRFKIAGFPNEQTGRWEIAEIRSEEIEQPQVAS